MQILKDNIRQRILVVARQEFITHGVRNTSIRSVARKTGIATGNIYNYFKSKDELFRAVLKPLIDTIERYILSHNEERHLNIDVFNVNEFQDEHIQTMKMLVKNFRPELRLLLFNAEGTSLAGYADRITDHQTHIGKEYLPADERALSAYQHRHLAVLPPHCQFHLGKHFLRTCATRGL